MKKIIIAVDGYSSCGKSTLAKQLSKHFNYIFIDTGAMYRAVTLYCLKNDIIKNGIVNEDLLNKHLDKINVEFRLHNREIETYLNGNNVESDIRGIEVSNNVSSLSKIAIIRKKLVFMQRKMGENKGIVMDGRDIGTVVFPEAELKLFMNADKRVRAERRYLELTKEKGIEISIEEVLKNIENRDYQDENRKESPLRKANDAIIIDNTHLTPQQQLEIAINFVNNKLV